MCDSAKGWIVLRPDVGSIHAIARRCLETVIIRVPKPTDLGICTWTGASSMGRIAAKHCHARAEFGSTKRNHMFSDSISYYKLDGSHRI